MFTSDNEVCVNEFSVITSETDYVLLLVSLGVGFEEQAIMTKRLLVNVCFNVLIIRYKVTALIPGNSDIVFFY
jgi:hypothetical protein